MDETGGSAAPASREIVHSAQLEDVTDRIFKPSRGTPMDELFTRYM